MSPLSRPADGIYVEALIRGALDDIWARTQQPELHERWDLRFTDIEYLPRPDTTVPQRFLYATRIGFGLGIEGEGESVGERDGASGERTSALKFWSDDPRSLIRDGRGYWKYIPVDAGVRFLTWYDYDTRFGVIGGLVDRVVFRPLLGWATAWSFDRLRLWIEKGLDPAEALRRSAVHATARVAIAFIFMYHGLVPKLLVRDPGELAMLRAAGTPSGVSAGVITALGVAEMTFGLLLILRWRDTWPLWTTILLMLVATTVVALTSPHVLTSAFNPVTLNAAVAALAAIGWLTCDDLPSAARCLRKPASGRDPVGE